MVELMLYMLILAVLMGGALLFLLPFLLLLGIRFYLVHEEERLVIYRMGRFQRVAGPGIVWVMQRFDEVEKRIDVREQPHDIEVSNLYFFDIPFGYTLNLWYRLDPSAAAGNDRALLHQIAQMPPEEVEDQIYLAIRNLMEDYLAQMPGKYNFSGNPSLLQKLLPLLPGQKGYQWLLAQLKSDLPDKLRSFGAIVSPDRPILLKSLSLSPAVVKLFNRARTVQSLREQQPDLSEDALMHLVTAHEDTHLQSVRKFVLEDARIYPYGPGYGDSNGHFETVDGDQPPTDDSEGVDQQAGHRNIPQEEAQKRSATPNSTKAEPDRKR